MSDDKHVLVSEDLAGNRPLAEGDRKLLDQIRDGEMIEVTPEMLVDLAASARETMTLFRRMVKDMPVLGAQAVRHLRVDHNMTWRGVAETMHKNFMESGASPDDLWLPPSNQLMGMALCERAAEILGENHMEGPWNDSDS